MRRSDEARHDVAEELIVRSATLADAGQMGHAYFEAERASLRSSYRHGVPEEWIPRSIEHSVSFWERRVRDPGPGSRVWVAEQAGVVVGLTHAGRPEQPGTDPKAGEIHALYVHPDSWGRGAGGGLLAAALEWLREQGYGFVNLWVVEGNDRARRFYEHHGFYGDGTRKIGQGGLPLLRYHRDL